MGQESLGLRVGRENLRGLQSKAISVSLNKGAE